MPTAPAPRTPGRDDSTPVSATIPELLSLLDRGLRPASMFNIRTANAAACAQVGGHLVVTMPTREGDLAEVRYVGGKAKLTLE